MLADTTIDARPLDLSREGFVGTVAELVFRVAPATPGDEAVLRAARRDPEQTPFMLEEKARWIEIEDLLRAAGLDTREIVQVMIRGVQGAFGFPVDDEVIAGLLREAGDAALAAEVAEAALALDALPGAAFGALEVLARAGAIDPRFDVLLTLDASGRTLSLVLDALPDPRRAQALSRLVPERADPRFADVQLERLLWVRGLLDAPDLRARVGALAEALRALPDAGEEVEALVARWDSGEITVAPLDADGLSAAAREAYAGLVSDGRAARARAQLGELCRAAHARRVRVSAPALASVAAWREAGPALREAAGRAVATRSSGALIFVEVRTYVDLPIVVLRHPPSGTLFSLVPGGSFQRGLSAPEEALLRARAGGARLLADLDVMRPLAEVEVGPLIVAQEACVTGDAAQMALFLEDEPFRLPSEAEWERLARADRFGELTPYGHHLPDEALLTELILAGERRPNRFGLWGFGLRPELCADVYHPSYEAAPRDGSPRWGEGPRVVRGGAADLTPWQDAAEWRLLCSANRLSEDAFPTWAARPALGVEIT